MLTMITFGLAFAVAAPVSPALSLAGLSFGGAEARRGPNIGLILADDLGYECIGANGSATYETPHLDELALSLDAMRTWLERQAKGGSIQ